MWRLFRSRKASFLLGSVRAIRLKWLLLMAVDGACSERGCVAMQDPWQASQEMELLLFLQQLTWYVPLTLVLRVMCFPHPLSLFTCKITNVRLHAGWYSLCWIILFSMYSPWPLTLDPLACVLVTQLQCYFEQIFVILLP